MILKADETSVKSHGFVISVKPAYREETCLEVNSEETPDLKFE